MTFTQMLDELKQIEVIAFDVFGTVFDFGDVERSEIGSYVDHVKSDVWQPLKLPLSWYTLRAHRDAVEGISRLRERYKVVTMSNCPMDMLVELSFNNGIDWDAIVPIQLKKVYKPHLEAYRTLFEVFPQVEPDQFMMVTANPAFGDIEASEALGMKPMVIRQEGCPATIIELAKMLGA